MHILHARGAEHMRILERGMSQGEHRSEYFAHHIGKLRNRGLPIHNGKLVPVLVILGIGGRDHDETHEKCY